MVKLSYSFDRLSKMHKEIEKSQMIKPPFMSAAVSVKQNQMIGDGNKDDEITMMTSHIVEKSAFVI